MLNKLVFATGNAHKAEEVKLALKGNFDILTLTDIGCHSDIPETGETLEANSLLKAMYVKEHYGMDCFADDTGLEVEALNGEPGVYSARYCGTKDNEANIDLLLQKLKSEKNRNARFRTVISLILNGEIKTFEGVVEGAILDERKGTGGFGYDSVFQPNGYNISMAEMTMDTKNSISHRGKAMRLLIDFLVSK
jgi:XTP/dITP diphosphohydrolase